MVRISEIYDHFWNNIEEEWTRKKRERKISTFVLLRGSKCTYCRYECNLEDSRVVPILMGQSAVIALVHNDCVADFLKNFTEKKEQIDLHLRRVMDEFWAEQSVKAMEMKKNLGFSEVTLMYDYRCAHCSKAFKPGDYFGAVTLGAEGKEAFVFVVHKQCKGDFFSKINERNPLRFGSNDVAKIVDQNLHKFLSKKPKDEATVRNAVVALLKSEGLDPYVEQGAVAFGQTSFKPDIILELYSLAIELKYCRGKQDLSRVTNGILSDIIAYKKDFREILFLVYDASKIVDKERFTKDIEKHSKGVQVLVVDN
jgi:hypothetical protein